MKSFLYSIKFLLFFLAINLSSHANDCFVNPVNSPKYDKICAQQITYAACISYDTDLGKACTWTGKIPEPANTTTTTQDPSSGGGVASSVGGSYNCQAKPSYKQYKPACRGRNQSSCESFTFRGSNICVWAGGNESEKPEPANTTSTSSDGSETSTLCNLDLGEYRKKCVVRSQKKCPPGGRGRQKCMASNQDLVNDSDPYCSQVQKECFPTATTSSEGENADPCDINLADYRKKCVKPSSQKCDSSTGAKCPSIVDTSDPFCSQVQRDCIPGNSQEEVRIPSSITFDSACECSFGGKAREIITCADDSVYDIRRGGLINSVGREAKPINYSDQGRDPVVSPKGQAIQQD